MAWTMSANLRGSFASSDLVDQRDVNGASWGKTLATKRILGGKVRGFGVWGLRFVALSHLTMLTLALTGGADTSTQVAIVATGLLLCLAFLMPNFMGKSPSSSDEVPQAETAVSVPAARYDYKLTSPNITPAFSDQTIEPGQAWTDLASRLSHELRTPLNAVIGFSDLMERELHGPLGSPQYTEYMRHIQNSGKALLKSAEDTLAMTSALARLDAPSATETVELGSLVKAAWNTLKTEANARGITFIMRVEADLSVVCDCATQRQILINMLGDVLRSSLDNGTVIVAAALIEGSVAIEITATHVSKSLPCEDSIDLCLARALLEVQNAPLKILHQPAGTRRLQTAFKADMQKNLF